MAGSLDTRSLIWGMSDEKASRRVIGVYTTSDATQVAPRRVDRMEERVRHDRIGVDEDKCVTFRVSRSGVSGSRNGLHRLMVHRSALASRNGSGLILAIVIDDDYVDVDSGASAQVRRRGLDRIQSRREVGLFIEDRCERGQVAHVGLVVLCESKEKP